MGRRILTTRPLVTPADGDTVPVNLPADLQPVYALAVGSSSEPGSYRVKAANMDEFILDCHHPFIGEDCGGSLRLNPPILITPNWDLQVNTPGYARVAAVDLMLYDNVPNWLPSRRAVLDSVTDPDSDGENSRSIIVQGRKRVVVMVRALADPLIVRYHWTSYDSPLMTGTYAFTDALIAGATMIREIIGGEAIQGAGEVQSGLADLLTVTTEVGGEDPGPSPAYYVIEAYDD